MSTPTLRPAYLAPSDLRYTPDDLCGCCDRSPCVHDGEDFDDLELSDEPDADAEADGWERWTDAVGGR